MRSVIVLLSVFCFLNLRAQLLISPNNDTLCLGAGLQLNASSSCMGNALFSWYVNGDSILTNQTGQFSLLPSEANNIITVICTCNLNGVLSTDTAQTNLTVIQTNISAGPDQFIDSGATVILQASGLYDSLLWSPSFLITYPTLPSVQTSPSATTTYMLQAYYLGCPAFDYVTVFLTNVFKIPNTFSPNNDGTNDTWIIPGISNYPDNTMRIMNRFGDALYESTAYNTVNAWTGIYNGKELPDGVYYYLLDLGNGTVKKGTISIIR